MFPEILSIDGHDSNVKPPVGDKEGKKKIDWKKEIKDFVFVFTLVLILVFCSIFIITLVTQLSH